jgi:hypothetical protein
MTTFEGIRNSVYTNLYGIPWNSAAYMVPFLLYFSLVFFILEFSFEGIRNSVHTNLYGIPQNFAVLYSKKNSRNYAK